MTYKPGDLQRFLTTHTHLEPFNEPNPEEPHTIQEIAWHFYYLPRNDKIAVLKTVDTQLLQALMALGAVALVVKGFESILNSLMAVVDSFPFEWEDKELMEVSA